MSERHLNKCYRTPKSLLVSSALREYKENMMNFILGLSTKSSARDKEEKNLCGPKIYSLTPGWESLLNNFKVTKAKDATTFKVE